MKMRIWGARGSIPTPLKPEQVEEKICQAISGLPDIDTNDIEAVRAYVRELPLLLRGTAGGNTPCVEIRSGEDIFIVDAGTGLRELGHELMKKEFGRGQGVAHIFISHTHWDHIAGWPFFTPGYVLGNKFYIYGGHPDLESRFRIQQTAPSMFPQPLDYLGSTIEFIQFQEGETIQIGRTRISAIRNAHTGDSYGYRFEDRHSILVCNNDAEFQELDHASLQPHIEFFRDADALVFDAMYTFRESYGMKKYWGHSSAMIGLDMARAAGVKKLLLFHYDHTCSDAELEEILATTVAYQTQDMTRPTCEVILAYEGLTLDLTPRGAADVQLLPDDKAAILTPFSVFDERGVNQLSGQLARLSDQDVSASSIIDLSQVETLTTASLKSLIALRQPGEGVIVLAAPSTSVRQVIKLGGYSDFFAIYPSVEAALAAIQARQALNLPGQVIQDRYQIEDKVGEGRLGAVLKATDTHLNRTVALKILSPSFSEETIEQFMRQARQVIALDHPNIVQAFAWDKDGDHSFMVEEFIAGQTLQDLLADGDAPLSPDQTLDIAMDSARALEYAHSRGVIHGDLKPQNIFLLVQEGSLPFRGREILYLVGPADLDAKLNGFGLGRLEQGRNFLDAPLLHLTAPYLAPEQILGQPLDVRTDLYALGVILYQLFTGLLPFDGPDQEVMQAHLQQSPRLPRELNPHISRSLEHLILKLLAKNPDDRYTSVGQARRVLSSLTIRTGDVTHQRQAPLVGRGKQLQALGECWEEARAGHGQLVFITGEPGVGKTSLAQQFAAQGQPTVLLIGRCQELQGSVSVPGRAYHLFTQVLRAYLASVPQELLEKNRQLAGLTHLLPEIRQMLPDLPDSSLLELKQEQLRLMTSLTQFIEQATQERPWLLILDDLQWADRSSLELLRYLSRHLPSMALLIIGIYHDAGLERDHPVLEGLRDLRDHPTYLHLPLGRLAQADVGQVLAHIWGQPVPTALIKKIYGLTRGNPLYVEQVAKGLADDGLITLQEGDGVGPEGHFPELEEVRLLQSVHEVVWRRICHLSLDTQALLRQAAVLGQPFRLDDLREMSGISEWQVLEHLDVALERGLVQEAPGDTTFRFSHAEIRHVLYADMGALRCRTLHRRAGKALERRALPEPERIAEELAHHFSKAGEIEMALVYSIRAADQAQAVYSNEAALLWYSRALEMLTVLALLLADQDEADELNRERAVELYALASRDTHVANSRWFQDVAEKHIAAVTATLPPDVVAAAQERGQTRDLKATVAELLVELEGEGSPWPSVRKRVSELGGLGKDRVARTTQPTAAVGVIAERFEISDPKNDLLGGGEMGYVYRGADTQTGQAVSIKVLKPEVLASQPDIVARFVREGQALRQLDHPNIVKMVDAVEENGQHYIVMEYVAGGSLRELLDAQRPDRSLAVSRALKIALELADALSRAHHLGIIHRDLKPANVLLAEDGAPRLTDFGHALLTASPRLTRSGALLGSVGYLSPEACNGEELDNRADIWALGVLLYEMLTGELPFVGESLIAAITAILTQPLPDLAALRPDAPEALGDLVRRMLEKERGRRVPSARQVGAELEAILAERNLP